MHLWPGGKGRYFTSPLEFRIYKISMCRLYRNTTGSAQLSRSVVSDSLQPQGLQHARPPCPSPTPGAFSNSRPSSRWCHPTIASSVVPFSSCLQSFPASGSFPMSHFFTSGGQSIAVSASASVLPLFSWWQNHLESLNVKDSLGH